MQAFNILQFDEEKEKYKIVSKKLFLNLHETCSLHGNVKNERINLLFNTSKNLMGLWHPIPLRTFVFYAKWVRPTISIRYLWLS